MIECSLTELVRSLEDLTDALRRFAVG